MLVPKRSVCTSTATSFFDVLHAGAVRQVVQRFGAPFAGAQFEVHHGELAADLRVGGLQLLGHLQRGLVDSQAGFHAHHHQVQGVGQAAGDGVLAAAYAEQ